MSNNAVIPQGGLSAGSTVMLAAIIGSDLYVMIRTTATSNTVEMVKAFDSSGGFITGVESRILKFTLGSMGEVVTFRLNSNLFLGYTGGGVFELQSTAPVMFFDQSNFQPLERPSILMSGVMYIPYGDETLGMKIMANIAGTPTEVLLIPVPVNIYVSCSTPTGNDAINDPGRALRMIQCSYPPTTVPSYCSSVGSVAWTNQMACFQGNTFEYCSAGTVCSGNCISACDSPTEVCTYQGNQNYVCQTTVQQFPSSSIPFTPVTTPAAPIEDSSWFTAVIFFIIFLIIGILLLAYYQSSPVTVNTSSESTAYHPHPIPAPMSYSSY